MSGDWGGLGAVGRWPDGCEGKKTYAQGMDWLKAHDRVAAIESFKKADKQDGGHCVAGEAVRRHLDSAHVHHRR